MRARPEAEEHDAHGGTCLAIRLLAVMTVLIGAGCTQGGDEPSPAGAGDPPASDAAEQIARSSEQIDIGGRSLHLQCWGEPVVGEPTVLLITGHGPTTSSWELMAGEFAADGHHLCSCDHAGVGGSDPAPEASRTTKDQVDGPGGAARCRRPAGAGRPRRALPRLASCRRIRGSCPGARRRSSADRSAATAPSAPRSGPHCLPEKPDGSRGGGRERRFLTGDLFDPAQNPEHLLLAASDDEVASAARRARADLRGPPDRRAPGARPSHPCPVCPTSYHAATETAVDDGSRSWPPSRRAARSSRSKTRATTSRTTNRMIVMNAIRDVMAG